MSDSPQSPTPALPAGAHFDPVTGAELGPTGADGARRRSYALQPGEPVASFSLVTSLLPLASGTAPQTYRWAIALGIAIPVVAAALGFLAFAFVAAALVVPAVYVVYLYDVNEWEDQPLAVVLGAVVAAAALGVGFTFLWHAGLLGDDLAPVTFDAEGASQVRWSSLLVLVLLVPVVSEVLKQVGPLLLARLPRFDDLIDGLTFGVAAGAAYAAAETLVVNRAVFSSLGRVDSPDAGFWVSLILSAAVVKPIVYGAATGIAVASFSGLGAGYDGFRPGYLRGLAEALVANVAFQAGLFFAALLEGTTGAVVGLVWGALVAAVLLLRLRHLLHVAVLEAALADGAHRDTPRGTAYCPSCEMPLLPGSGFCVACGTSVRAGNKLTRARNRSEEAPTAPVRDNRTSAVVVAAVTAVILLGGVIGQVVSASMGTAPAPSTDPPVTISPQIGAQALSEAPRTALGEGLAPAAGGKGGIVALSDDVLFLVPKGFKIEDPGPGFAQVFGFKGYFFAYLEPKKTTLPKLITANLTGIEQMGVQDLAISEPEAIAVDGVQGAATLNYQGALATQQGGTIPVEGFAFYFVRSDGTGATAFALYGRGALKNKKLLDGYNTMLSTLIGTL